MESENTSTHEESSKIQSGRESSEYSNRITRKTLQFNLNKRNRSKGSIMINNDKNKKNLNESLPIKNTLSVFDFKIVLIGNVSVGKSSIIKRFVRNEFNDQYFCTIGTELFKKSLLISENKMVNLCIWDTCGQERYRTVTRQYYRDTQAILLVFDLTNEKSFYDLHSWYEEAIDYINESKCLFFLLGNKSDEDDINVSDKNIKNFMRKNPKIKKYFDVSALNGHNIDIAFDKISQYLIMTFGVEEINKNIKEYKKNINIENDDRNHNANKVKCC